MDYTWFSQSRNGARGAGVALYIHNSLKADYYEKCAVHFPDLFEMVTVIINYENK